MSSLIEKIDAEIARLHEERKSMHSAIDADRIWLKIDEAEKIRELILSEQKQPCEYILIDEDCNAWECNKCGQAWTLNSGTPKDNNMNFCNGCGRPINQPSTGSE